MSGAAWSAAEARNANVTHSAAAAEPRFKLGTAARCRSAALGAGDTAGVGQPRKSLAAAD